MFYCILYHAFRVHARDTSAWCRPNGRGQFPSPNAPTPPCSAQCKSRDQVRSRRQLLSKMPHSHEFMNSEAQNACGWDEERDICPACCWRGHPPGRPPARGLCGQRSSCSGSSILQSLGRHQYLQGCCVTSYGHQNYSVGNRQRGSQSHSAGRHEKCQPWASSHSCPLTAVGPQTKVAAV